MDIEVELIVRQGGVRLEGQGEVSSHCAQVSKQGSEC
jgi:hypothetical protein